MKVLFICTVCKKINFGDGVWSNLNETAPKNAVTALCPNCSHERFPQFYSDYENPEGRFRKKMSDVFSSKSKR